MTTDEKRVPHRDFTTHDEEQQFMWLTCSILSPNHCLANVALCSRISRKVIWLPVLKNRLSLSLLMQCGQTQSPTGTSSRGGDKQNR